MKLFQSLLLPVFIGAASALSDASVYIFQGDEWPNTSTPPTLTPEQARLVFARRLGASRYHRLGGASESTLGYINKFGGHGDSLFYETTDKAAELVLIVEGVSSSSAEPLLEAWSSLKPAFTISTPPSMTANKKLVSDLHQQCGQEGKTCAFEDAINPFNANCWNGKSKIIHFDLASDKTSSKIDELMATQERLTRFAKKEEMNVVVVLMPEASRLSKNKANPYGSYDKISQSPIIKRSKPTEEPITETGFSAPLHYSKQVQMSNVSGNSTFKPITGIPPLCHASKDSCISATNNCSGHGECYKKSGGSSEGKGGCYTCFCKPTLVEIPYPGGEKNGTTLQYWGGSACHKKDISDSFWLISIFVVVLVGVTTWAIAMIFSIGEEKLPGVIGAGVSGKAK
ncbi:uncharacterized protein PAC_04901 [Phialocephala subalpina]|uniref:Uncharacterized protein n=1 Tax=Phialocephala subalpina TaxID=576137 RepID=A0A1L7WQH8_9HELO|nr:uncharacterized protein PAC_04901 [Phialocephala subalpina]